MINQEFTDLLKGKVIKSVSVNQGNVVIEFTDSDSLQINQLDRGGFHPKTELAYIKPTFRRAFI